MTTNTRKTKPEDAAGVAHFNGWNIGRLGREDVGYRDVYNSKIYSDIYII